MSQIGRSGKRSAGAGRSAAPGADRAPGRRAVVLVGHGGVPHDYWPFAGDHLASFFADHLRRFEADGPGQRHG